MKLQKFVFNLFAENTYLVWDEKSKIGIIIDPGCYDIREETMLKEFIRQNKIELKYLINTHCHIDHIFGNSFIKKNWNAHLLASKDDDFLIDLFDEQASLFNLTVNKSPHPDNYLSEDLSLDGITFKIQFIATPGHSPGGYCICFPEENICFTGDTLFYNTIGRTDLWEGDYKKLIDSIKIKLLTLPDDVIIYAGHGKESTIGFEKLNNQYLI
jgi:hydroxyacylglutathione hydrolase